jgi:hypothetical protein
MPLVRRRPLLRAAAVGAVGYSAAKAGTRSAQAEQQQAEQAQYQQEQMSAQQQMVPPPPPPTYAQPAPAPAAAPDRVSQLQDLAKLHDSGALTDAEFEQEKKRVLGS